MTSREELIIASFPSASMSCSTAAFRWPPWAPMPGIRIGTSGQVQRTAGFWFQNRPTAFGGRTLEDVRPVCGSWVYSPGIFAHANMVILYLAGVSVWFVRIMFREVKL